MSAETSSLARFFDPDVQVRTAQTGAVAAKAVAAQDPEDRSVISTLFGVPIGFQFGTALGIKNPFAALLVDIFTDPTTYLTGGLGALTKLGRAVKFAKGLTAAQKAREITKTFVIAAKAAKKPELAKVARELMRVGDAEGVQRVARMFNALETPKEVRAVFSKRVQRELTNLFEQADLAVKEGRTLQKQLGKTLGERAARGEQHLFDFKIPFTNVQKTVIPGRSVLTAISAANAPIRGAAAKALTSTKALALEFPGIKSTFEYVNRGLAPTREIVQRFGLGPGFLSFASKFHYVDDEFKNAYRAAFREGATPAEKRAYRRIRDKKRASMSLKTVNDWEDTLRIADALPENIRPIVTAKISADIFRAGEKALSVLPEGVQTRLGKFAVPTGRRAVLTEAEYNRVFNQEIKQEIIANAGRNLSDREMGYALINTALNDISMKPNAPSRLRAQVKAKNELKRRFGRETFEEATLDELMDIHHFIRQGGEVTLADMERRMFGFAGSGFSLRKRMLAGREVARAVTLHKGWEQIDALQASINGLIRQRDALIRKGAPDELINRYSARIAQDSERLNDIVAGVSGVENNLSLMGIGHKTLGDPRETLERIAGRSGVELYERTLQAEKEVAARVQAATTEINNLLPGIERGSELDKKIFDVLNEGIDSDVGSKIMAELSASERAGVIRIKQILDDIATELKLEPGTSKRKNYITNIYNAVGKAAFDDVSEVSRGRFNLYFNPRQASEDPSRSVVEALNAYLPAAYKKLAFTTDRVVGNATLPALLQFDSAGKLSGGLAVDVINAHKRRVPEIEQYVHTFIDHVRGKPNAIDRSFRNSVRKFMSYLNDKATGTELESVTNLLTQLIYHGTMGLNLGSAVVNLTQNLNTFAVVGHDNIVDALKLVSQRSRAGSNIRKLLGVNLQDITASMRGFAIGKKGIISRAEDLSFKPFSMVEGFNRTVAGLAGYLQEARKAGANLDDVVSNLERMIVDDTGKVLRGEAGLNREWLRKSQQIVKDTQFSFLRADTSPILRSRVAKPLTQFGRFTTGQLGFFKDMIVKGYLGEGDIAPMMRYVAGSGTLVSGAALLGMDFTRALGDYGLGAASLSTPPIPEMAVQLGQLTGLLDASEIDKRLAETRIKRNFKILMPWYTTLQKATRAFVPREGEGHVAEALRLAGLPVRKSDSGPVGVVEQWLTPDPE